MNKSLTMLLIIMAIGALATHELSCLTRYESGLDGSYLSQAEATGDIGIAIGAPVKLAKADDEEEDEKDEERDKEEGGERLWDSVTWG